MNEKLEKLGKDLQCFYMHLTNKFVRSRLSPYRFNPEIALL